MSQRVILKNHSPQQSQNFSQELELTPSPEQSIEEDSFTQCGKDGSKKRKITEVIIRNPKISKKGNLQPPLKKKKTKNFELTSGVSTNGENYGRSWTAMKDPITNKFIKGSFRWTDEEQEEFEVEKAAKDLEKKFNDIHDMLIVFIERIK
jgi:hypothetical protein